MLNKLKRAALGAHTPHDKATAASKPVPMPLPAQVRILMSQHIGAPAKALVKKGDEVFVGTKIGDKLGRLLTKVFIDTALHNRKICLTVAIFAVGCLIVVPSAAQPAQSQRQRLFGILIVGIARRTLVKRHHYVGTDGTLYVDHSLWREQMFRAVDV